MLKLKLTDCNLKNNTSGISEFHLLLNNCTSSISNLSKSMVSFIGRQTNNVAHRPTRLFILYASHLFKQIQFIFTLLF